MNYKLYQGDCLEVMETLPNHSIDLILTDPPYGTTACNWDSIIPFNRMWEKLTKLRKEKTAIVLFGAEPFSSYLRISNIKEYKYDWIWEKERPTNIFTMKYSPGKVHEIISVFYKHNYYPIMEKSKQPNNNNKYLNKSQSDEMNTVLTIGAVTKISDEYNPKQRYPRSILYFSRGTRRNKKLHPTQKPVKLMEYLIKTYTKENYSVLDFTMGSGTTGVAAIKLNRSFIGIELDKEYYEIAKQRIEYQVSFNKLSKELENKRNLTYEL